MVRNIDFSHHPTPQVAPLPLWDAEREGTDFNTAAHDYIVDGLIYHLSLNPSNAIEAADEILEAKSQNFAQAISKTALHRIIKREEYDSLPPIRRSIVIEGLADRAFISVYNTLLDSPPKHPPDWYTYWAERFASDNQR